MEETRDAAEHPTVNRAASYSEGLVKVKLLSCVRLFVTPWTVAHQAPLSMGFSRQEYWSGLPFPSPGDLPNPGIEPRSLALQANTLTSEPPGRVTCPKTSAVWGWEPLFYNVLRGSRGSFPVLWLVPLERLFGILCLGLGWPDPPPSPALQGTNALLAHGPGWDQRIGDPPVLETVRSPSVWSTFLVVPRALFFIQNTLPLPFPPCPSCSRMVILLPSIAQTHGEP